MSVQIIRGNALDLPLADDSVDLVVTSPPYDRGETRVRILVTGSRDWTDERAVWNALRGVSSGVASQNITVVHGACPTGADAIADRAARVFGMNVERHPADWSLGKKAGPLRNQHMVDLGADYCIAFPLPGSRGTKHCMTAAAKAGIPVLNKGADA